MTLSYENAVSDIIKAGNRLDRMQLAPATSGNYSMRTGDNEMAITVSGAHKGQLQADQIMRADLEGQPLEDKKPSAETLLHSVLYQLYPEVNAVLHTHSIACSVLTRLMSQDKFMVLEGYEMLKAYAGVETHEMSVRLPIFENTQDMSALSEAVVEVLKAFPKAPAYLIRGHGIYGWGRDMAEAERVIEATEMLLSCEMHMKQIGSTK
ncbi:MAG: methylthioribulose-1-phosphate dehydratase [Alphaproteobacteria bacterium]|nr:MAG: methylthioribulose-1-phosphate dehydratase [Alphaproteobacteria bacterium]